MDLSKGEPRGRTQRTAFVGRETELDWLLERLHRAAQGRPRACLVRGEPGVGKSRLLAELGRHALSEGFHVWSLRGTPDVQTPYLALDALLQDLAKRCVCGPELAEASARWWKPVREQGDVPGALATAPFGPPQRALSRAFQRALLERAAHGGGFVLLIDNLHWLDGPSLELVVEALAELDARAAEEPVRLALVAATAGAERGSSAELAERRLELEMICDALQLLGFEDRETEEFLRALGIDPPARAFAARLRQAARGSPARLEALVRELRRRGALVQRGRSWVATLDPLAIGEEAASPLDLALDDPLRRALRVLGLFAVETPHEAVAAACGAAPGAVAELLTAAESRGLLRRGKKGFLFEDAALGRALGRELSEADRSILHHRIARWLETAGEHDPETLAHHWWQGWPDAPAERVIDASRRAAQQAMRARDWRRAAFHYERALQVAERGALSPSDAADLHYRAGLAHFRSLDGEPSRVHFEHAAQAYLRCGDLAGEVRARVESMRSIVSLGSATYGSKTEGLAELGPLIDALPDEEAGLRAYASAELATAHAMSRDHATAELLARRAIEISRSAGDDVRCLAYENLGIVLLGKLDLEGAAQAYREALRFGRRTGDAWLESLALNRLPIALAWQGRLDEARSYLLEAREAADVTGDWADYSLAIGTLAAVALARGEFDEVESLARQAVSIARRSGYVWGAALAVSAVAPARALRGRLDEALDAAVLLETPGGLVREVPPMWAAMAAVLRIRLVASVGEVDARTREQATGLASVLLATETDPHTLPALCACIEIAARADDVELAERVGLAVQQAAQEVVFTPALDEVLARSLGLVAEVAGRWDEAVARFEEALETAERSGARMLQARIHADLGRVLARTRRLAEAKRNTERALVLAEALGMEPLRARCAALLAAGDEPTEASRRSAGRGPREQRLLRSIAAGLSDDAIASDLLLTTTGFQRLRARVLEEIGLASDADAEAVARALTATGQAVRGIQHEEMARRAPPVQGPPLRALALFVSDIANSSELIQRLGDEAARSVIQEHNRIARTHLRRHGGVELQHTGDGFIASFDHAAHALHCAVELQQELDQRSLGTAGAPLRIRIGVHLGEPLLEEDRLFGVAMHTAARICGACEGGQVLVSDEAWCAAGDVELLASNLGPVALRGIFEPVRLHLLRPTARLPGV
jgi:class 3 adenylate cyclase